MPFPASEALPITRRRCRRSRKDPATQAERDAIQWKAIKAEFNWSNDEWAETWLPWVRVAACHVDGDRTALKSLMLDLISAGDAPNVLEGLTRTKIHLQALVELTNAALSRSFLVLEELGYSAENQPPVSRVN